MNTKGFIFDLDGVIVDTAKYHFLAWKALANGIGIDFSQEQNEQLKGVSRVKSLEKILNWGNKTISQEAFNTLMHSKNEQYLSYIETMDANEILPHVPRVLNFLIEENQPISLGVDGNDVSKAKPDPEVFLSAAKHLKKDPEACIVFEDSVAGIQAANAAKMVSIGIGEVDVLHEADYIFKDFTEMSNTFLMELIKK